MAYICENLLSQTVETVAYEKYFFFSKFEFLN